MKKYLESTRIASLLAKRAMHSITSEERGELDSLLKKTGVNPDEILKGSLFIAPDVEEVEAQQRVFDAVKVQISTAGRSAERKDFVPGSNVAGGVFKVRRYLQYAAVFVVLLALSLFAYYAVYDSKTVLKPHNDSIKAYVNETVLVLPNGERVVQSNSTNVADVIKLARENESANASAKKNQNIFNAAGESKRVAEVYKIKVSRGSTHTVMLEDGTRVILYPESELEFPEFFGKSGRSVKLSGEGYFDVQKEASRPFTVSTLSASVVVLGTSFNIRAYENEAVTETVLVTGKVLMNNTEMVPNQIAILDRSSREVRVESVDASVYSERAMGMFVFENRSLDEIMREFSHWFGFEYSFDSDALSNKKFRIKLPRTDNFNLLMDLMEKTGEMRFEVNEQNIEIKSVKR